LLTKIGESKVKGIWKNDVLENMVSYTNLKAMNDYNLDEFE